MSRVRFLRRNKLSNGASRPVTLSKLEFDKVKLFAKSKYIPGPIGTNSCTNGTMKIDLA